MEEVRYSKGKITTACGVLLPNTVCSNHLRRKRIICMLESDRKKGAMTYAEVVMQLRVADTTLLEKWGLRGCAACAADPRRLRAVAASILQPAPSRSRS